MKKLIHIEKQADGFLKKYAMRYDLGNGETYDWEMVSPREIRTADDIAQKPTTVELICRFENGDFLLIREFRYPINRFCYSFPTGIMDPGETVEEAAERELFEETGLSVVRIDEILPAGNFAAGLCDELIAPVRMTVAGSMRGSTDPVEEIVPCRMTPAEVRALLRDRDLSITLSCLLVLKSLPETGG